MTFEDVLSSIANAYGLDAFDLVGYSYEDEISGWDSGFGEWPVGSLWTVEGRILYALVRAIQPEVVVEIGTNVGCSASHIASALRMNGTGKLLSFDTAEQIVIPPDRNGHSATYKAGGLIPAELLPFVELIQADGIAYLRDYIAEADMIFEDGSHSLESTRDAWIAGMPKLNPGGFMLSHDAAHFLVGSAIQRGIAAAGVVPNIYEVAPSDCGLAIWRKPGEASKPIPLSAFVPNGDGELVDFDYQFDKPKGMPTPNYEDMSLKELRTYADLNGIELGSARSKSKIIDLLRGA